MNKTKQPFRPTLIAVTRLYSNWFNLTYPQRANAAAVLALTLDYNRYFDDLMWQQDHIIYGHHQESPHPNITCTTSSLEIYHDRESVILYGNVSDRHIDQLQTFLNETPSEKIINYHRIINPDNWKSIITFLYNVKRAVDNPNEKVSLLSLNQLVHEGYVHA